MKSKQKQKKRSDNPFWSAIQDVRKLTKDFNNDKEKKLFNEGSNKVKQKGQKMPVKMLSGIRKKVLSDYKNEKERSLTEQVQYHSLQKFNDKKFLDKKIKKHKKSDFQKNQYKYSGMKSSSFGKFKGGVLQVSKNQIKKMKKSN
ncbi:hypothetical protein PPERSA_03833 [Pseudocohnilembus persalinus]|uniref:Uncharacterized protein n=1 Tax=Pseudocohnilembus persalinus TaxID=266149 RepID=A0A0V0QVC7_PSEPJ|nr:hypothetical protein PPERSA_03833 [Pseudocohnilembus persalinus]|eukprot:KRX05896.1 hypothetical protein PPERSA_03833 [Pseudocohnilembus persalinus]